MNNSICSIKYICKNIKNPYKFIIHEIYIIQNIYNICIKKNHIPYYKVKQYIELQQLFISIFIFSLIAKTQF